MTNISKYKVGDWIKHLTLNDKKEPYVLYKIIGMGDTSYQLELRNGSQYNKLQTLIENETYWELATEQELIDAGIKERPFTVGDFKPFDKVLVRDTDVEHWRCNLFGYFNKKASCDKYECVYGNWVQCIPYNDETSKLLGTKNDCPDKYKTW